MQKKDDIYNNLDFTDSGNTDYRNNSCSDLRYSRKKYNNYNNNQLY